MPWVKNIGVYVRPPVIQMANKQALTLNDFLPSLLDKLCKVTCKVSHKLSFVETKVELNWSETGDSSGAADVIR